MLRAAVDPIPCGLPLTLFDLIKTVQESLGTITHSVRRSASASLTAVVDKVPAARGHTTAQKPHVRPKSARRTNWPVKL